MSSFGRQQLGAWGPGRQVASRPDDERAGVSSVAAEGRFWPPPASRVEEEEEAAEASAAAAANRKRRAPCAPTVLMMVWSPIPGAGDGYVREERRTDRHTGGGGGGGGGGLPTDGPMQQQINVSRESDRPSVGHLSLSLSLSAGRCRFPRHATDGWRGAESLSVTATRTLHWLSGVSGLEWVRGEREHG